MSTFAVGDLCIFVAGGPPWLAPVRPEFILRPEFIGKEVTVTRIPSRVAPFEVDVLDADGIEGGTMFVCLRKRRPPQDWQTLCKLDEVPSDCVAEREVVA